MPGEDGGRVDSLVGHGEVGQVGPGEEVEQRSELSSHWVRVERIVLYQPHHLLGPVYQAATLAISQIVFYNSLVLLLVDTFLSAIKLPYVEMTVRSRLEDALLLSIRLSVEQLCRSCSI